MKRQQFSLQHQGGPMAAVPGLTSIYRIVWFEQRPSLSITPIL
jgi:hypothetical protein